MRTNRESALNRAEIESHLESARREIAFLEDVERLLDSGRVAWAAERLAERRRTLEDYVASFARPVGPERTRSDEPMTLEGVIARLESAKGA